MMQVFAADEWRRHGKVVPACLAGMMLIGVHTYSLGVMIAPLEREFGWTRSQISAAAMFPAIAAVFLAPFAGRAVDRFGARHVALAGVPLFCGAFGLLAATGSSIWSWWGLYGLLGAAMMLVFPTVWTAAINLRFVRNRGLALAIVLSGTGIGSAILPMLVTFMVEWQGWRGAYVLVALLCLLVVFPLVFFLLPADEARPADTAKAPAGASGLGLPPEVRSGKFVRLALAALIFGLSACMLTVNAVPILLGEGFEPLDAARIAGAVGVGTILGRLGGGILLDRIDARYVAIATGVAPIVGALLLLSGDAGEGAALIACLLLGIAGGTEYDVCAYLTARHFDTKDYGALFGVVAGLSVLAAGIAPFLANYSYDITGSYDFILWAILPAFAVAAWLFVSLGRCPD